MLGLHLRDQEPVMCVWMWGEDREARVIGKTAMTCIGEMDGVIVL